MTQNWRDELDEQDGDGSERRVGGPPERSNRPVANRAKARASRTRTNDVAKRGMHQRRNKRIAW